MPMGYQAHTEMVPDGDAGIERTLSSMRRFIERGSGQAEVIRLARNIVRFVPERDVDGEAKALHAWVRGHLRFTKDPVNKELVTDPEYMLRDMKNGVITGDCDEATTLLGALLQAIGIETEPVVVSPDEGSYTHVLLRYRSPSRGWVTLDPITNNQPGWFPMGAARVGTYKNGRINPSSPVTVQGLSGYPCMGGPIADAVRRAGDKVEPATNLIWFGIGVLTVWKFLKTGRGLG